VELRRGKVLVRCKLSAFFNAAADVRLLFENPKTFLLAFSGLACDPLRFRLFVVMCLRVTVLIVCHTAPIPALA
jgi:hypothetical protein